MIDTNFADLAQQLAARRDQLQAEIDAAMDAHGVICRAHDLLAGTATIVTAMAAEVTEHPSPEMEKPLPIKEIATATATRPCGCGGTGRHRATCPTKTTIAPEVAPKSEPPPTAEQPRRHGEGAKVLACTECDFECAVTEAGKLNHHALSSHNRRATVVERQPVPAATSAA